MPPEHLEPDNPREWLNRARSNLLLAQVLLPDVYLEDLCFDAQQAAEKAIKAVLLAHQIEFPYIHDLARLLTLVEQAGEQFPEAVRVSAGLTRYAVAARYPGAIEAVTPDEHQQAIATAAAVVTWAEQRIDAIESESQNPGDRES